MSHDMEFAYFQMFSFSIPSCLEHNACIHPQSHMILPSTKGRTSNNSFDCLFRARVRWRSSKTVNVCGMVVLCISTVHKLLHCFLLAVQSE